MDPCDVSEHATKARQPQAELAGLVLVDVRDHGAVAARGDEQVAWGERHDVEEGEAERGGEDDEGGRGEGRGGRWRGRRWVVCADGTEGAVCVLHVGDMEGGGEEGERERSWSWELGGWTNNNDADGEVLASRGWARGCGIISRFLAAPRTSRRNMFQLYLKGFEAVQ